MEREPILGNSSLCRLWCLVHCLLSVEEGMVDIWPELMSAEGDGVNAYIQAPSACGVVKGSFS